MTRLIASGSRRIPPKIASSDSIFWGGKRSLCIYLRFTKNYFVSIQLSASLLLKEEKAIERLLIIILFIKKFSTFY